MAINGSAVLEDAARLRTVSMFADGNDEDLRIVATQGATYRLQGRRPPGPAGHDYRPRPLASLGYPPLAGATGPRLAHYSSKRATASDTLWPPKPNEFDMANSTSMRRASLGT